MDTLEFEWGTPVLPAVVDEQLKKREYRLIAVVHDETSTGVCNPMHEIAEFVAKTDSLFLVDTVTGLGGLPVEVDKWKADAVYSGTQKCLSCPPGLAPITFSEKAVRKTLDRKNKVPNWYLDLSMIINYWEGKTRAYHHTEPINMLYGLYEALYQVLDEGLEAVYRLHRETHLSPVEMLESLGMEMLVAPDCRLPMLNSVKIPDQVDEAAIRSRLLNDFQIEIGAGLGPLAGKIWRIGLTGHTARQENVDRLGRALSACLSG